MMAIELKGADHMSRLIAWTLITLCLVFSLPAGAAPATSQAAVRYKGAAYRIGQTSTQWKKNLGGYTRKKSGVNGALTSYVYTFKKSGVRVKTLYSSKLKKEKIVSILVVGKSVATVGGLKVGHGYAKMTGIYGSKFARSGKVFTYKSGKRRLQVKAAGGRVASFKIS